MRIAVRAPDAFGAAALEFEQIVAAGASLGVTAIELAGSAIEASLGKPVVPPQWLELPDNAFETGALPLEEEIMRDEIALTQQSIDEMVRRWRTSVSLAPLDSLRQRADAAGVQITILAWADLARLSDANIDWCFRVAKALGAQAVVTPLVVGAPRRLASFADRQAMTIAFDGNTATRPADFEAALGHSSFHAASLDLRAWVSAGHGSPLPFLHQHAGRVMQVRLDALDVVDGPMAAVTSELLAETRASGWHVQFTIGLESGNLQGSDRAAALARTIDYCLNGLRLNT